MDLIPAITAALVGLVALPLQAPLSAQLREAQPPPFVATPEDLVEQMLRLGDVSQDDLVVDLGSGDGRLVIAAAASGARGIGVEYDERLVELSRARARSAGVADRVRFLHEDIFRTDVSGADVVMLYLSADFNLRLRPRLLEQLRPGSRVVSHAFHMGDWEPDSTVTLGSGASRATLFSWVIPANVDGFWSLEIQGMDPVILEFRQKYQRLEGTASTSGTSFPLTDGAMTAERIRFSLAGLPGASPGTTLHGALLDGHLSGTATTRGDATVRRWRAFRFSDPRRFESFTGRVDDPQPRNLPILTRSLK
jgi:SAM-dependent methyltransferase